MPSEVTDIRNKLEAIVNALEGVHRVNVQLGPSEYEAAQTNFLVTVIVGEPTDGNREVVDELYGTVRDAVNGAGELAAFTTKCTGHRLYAQGPNDPPELGCEWTVKVVM